MALAPNASDKVHGIFTNAGSGKYFEFEELNTETQDIYGQEIGATHKIYVGPQGECRRYAKVKKTVAYVAVDENEFGTVWEKWDIKGCRDYRTLVA